MSRSPTFSETYDSLLAVASEAQKGLYRLGQIRGRNDLQAEQQLLSLVASESKIILTKLPCLQLESDEIEQMDSKYCHLLTQIEEAAGGEER